MGLRKLWLPPTAEPAATPATTPTATSALTGASTRPAPGPSADSWAGPAAGAATTPPSATAGPGASGGFTRSGSAAASPGRGARRAGPRAGPRAGRRAGRRASDGLSLEKLVAAHGGQLPITPQTPAERAELAQRSASQVGAHGRFAPGHGWSPVPQPPLRTYLASSRQLGGLFPFVAGNGLPPTGAAIGQDVLTGGTFHLDPVAWTKADPAITSNTNLLCFGKPGAGKSAILKLAIMRMLRFGMRVRIAGDVKGEYTPLCAALGWPAIDLGPGRPARVNALDTGPLGRGLEALSGQQLAERMDLIFERWTTLVMALLGAESVSTTPSDRTLIRLVLEHLTGTDRGASVMAQVTLPQVWAALHSPSDDLVRAARYRSREAMIDATRTVTDALGNLVHGPLHHLFDAPTNIDIDWDAPIVSLSLEGLRGLGDRTVAIALTCLNSWFSSHMITRSSGQVTLTVRDEAWRQMRLGVEAVLSLDADLRLSRADGQIQWMAAHKPSDMEGVGAAGSQAVSVARDFMALCDTKILLAQDANIADSLAEMLDLNAMTHSWVTGWAGQKKGRAVWLVGEHVAKVESIATPWELAMLDTNQALSG